MTKSVDILITNFNGGETVALCIESIRKYTRYPHGIIVYDDGSFKEYQDELRYLREVRDRGWIKLIESPARHMHGYGVKTLLAATQADLAMIIDNDIQIVGDGWLEAMVETQAKRNAVLVADQESFPDDNVAISSWFFMLDMAQYPDVADTWDYTQKVEGQPDLGFRPTGWRVWKKIQDQGKRIEPLPRSVLPKFRHHTHIGVLSYPMSGPNWEVRVRRYKVIQNELRRLRASA
jgi:glycosyltransferase involved in cell wall biosynthesis